LVEKHFGKKEIYALDRGYDANRSYKYFSNENKDFLLELWELSSKRSREAPTPLQNRTCHTTAYGFSLNHSQRYSLAASAILSSFVSIPPPISVYRFVYICV